MSGPTSVETTYVSFSRNRVLLLLFSIPAISAQNVVLTLGSGSGTPGTAVTLPITLTTLGGAQPASLQWSFSYPTAITGVTVTIGTAATSAQKLLACGGSACAIYGTNQNSISSGIIANATFQLAPGASGVVPISLINVIASSAAAGSIPASSGSGTVVVSASPSLSTVGCAVTSIATPGSTSCAVTLSAPAPVGGLQVSLLSNNANLSVPTNVTVSAGQTTATFSAIGATVNTDQTGVTITASAGGATNTASLSLLAPARLQSLSCSPSTIGSNVTSTCTAVLTKAAVNPVQIYPSSNTTLLTVPIGVIIAPGQTSASFSASAGTITTASIANISVTSNGQTLTAQVLLSTAVQLYNPATYQPGQACSPGAIATVTGTGFTNQTPQAATGSSWPLQLSGVHLNVNDQPVPLLYASGTLIHFQCPALAPGTDLRIVVKSDTGQSLGAISTVMQVATPGVYVLNDAHQGAVLIAGTDLVASTGSSGPPGRAARKGEYISIYADGLGPLNEVLPPGEPAPLDRLIRATVPVTVVIGDSELVLSPSFVGLTPGIVSLFVVNVQLTSDVQTGPSIPLYLKVSLSNGTVVSSNTVRIAVANADPP